MLKEQFRQAVEWCLSPQKRFESGRRLGQWLLGDWIEARDKMEQAHLRQQLIHNQAARAVEWNWGRTPEQLHDFIRMETPPGGYLWGVTPREIFDYSQKHCLELLPQRVDDGSKPELDAMRRTLERQGLATPAPHPG